MRIHRVTAAGFKGRDFTHELGDLNLFCGPNDSGKTAAVDAVKLGLLGYHPTYGKTNQGIFRLAHGRKLSVDLELADGSVLRRSWSQGPQNITKRESGVDGLPVVPLTILHGGKFISASEAEQAKTIFELARIEFSPESLRDAILGESALDGELVVVVRAALQAVDEDEEGNPQRWLEGAIGRIGDLLKEQNSERNRLEKMAEGIAQMAASDRTINESEVRQKTDDLIRRRAELERLLGDLESKRDEHARKVSEHQVWASRVQALRTELGEKSFSSLESIRASLRSLRDEKDERGRTYQRACEAWNSLQDAVSKRKTFEARIEGFQGIIERCRPWVEALPQIQQADQEATRLVGETVAARDRVERLRDILVTMRAQCAALGVQIKSINQQGHEMKGAQCCPTCQASYEGWRDTVMSTLKAQRDALVTEKTNLCGQIAGIEDELREATQLYDSLLELQGEKSREAASLKQAEQAARDLETFTAKLQQDEEEIKRIDELVASSYSEPPVVPDLSVLNARIEAFEIEEAFAIKSDKLRDLLAGEPQVDLNADFDAQIGVAQEKLVSMLAEDEEVRQLEQLAANQRADEKRLQQAQDDREKAEGRVAALKVVKEKMTTQRDALVNDAFGPLLQVVNRFTAGILPSDLEFHNGELGRFQEGTFVSLRCFGDTHQAVAVVGLQAALGAQSPFKIVIVDEMGRFDQGNKVQFLSNVQSALQAKLIEQFIGVDVDNRPYVNLQGVRVISTGEVKEEKVS